MTHTPQSIEQALIDIAYTIADEYDAQIKTLDPSAKTEKKALSIQREIARLSNHAGLNGFSGPNYERHMELADRRFRNITAPYPAVTAYYNALTEDDRRIVLHYLRSLYFMAYTFLIPWKAELTRAKETGDIAAVFELELKINTVKRVLDARNAWWREHADELPPIPADIRDGKEVQL